MYSDAIIADPEKEVVKLALLQRLCKDPDMHVRFLALASFTEVSEKEKREVAVKVDGSIDPCHQKSPI